MNITVKNDLIESKNIEVGDVFYSENHNAYLQLINSDLDTYSVIVLNNYSKVYDRDSCNVSKEAIIDFLKSEVIIGKLKHLPQAEYSYNLEIVKL